MKVIQRYLADIAESRRSAQEAARAAFLAPPSLSLPVALEVALRHHWLVVPLLACSVYALRSARIGVPSSEREQVEFWFARHGDEVNWLLEVGEHSGVIAIEIDPALASDSLATVDGADAIIEGTLRFEASGRHVALFTFTQRMNALPVLLPGLRLLTRGSILIPPSRTYGGHELVYADPFAPLLSPERLIGARILR